MGKSFRLDALDQGLRLPPSLHDWLPEDHLARFVADVVAALDLEPIYHSYARATVAGSRRTLPRR